MLEKEIKLAQEKVSKTKAAYDAAVEELSRLLDQRDHMDASQRISGEDMTFTWNGDAVWDAGGGTVDCEYEAKVDLRPTEDGIRGPEVRRLQMDTPDFTPEDLYLALEKSLRNKLDMEFEDYCTDDDYYQPVVEDFEAEIYVREWAEERGLEIVSFEGDGSDGGFEPKSRRHR